MAKGVAEHLASTILEAEGTAYGNPGVQAGKKIKIAGVAEEFVGEWIVTAARHELRVRGRRLLDVLRGQRPPRSHAARAGLAGRVPACARRRSTAT